MFVAAGRFALALLSLGAAVTPLRAQRTAPGLRPPAVGEYRALTEDATAALGDSTTAVPRALLGVGGAVAGLYVGTWISGMSNPMEDVDTGAIVGMLVGAALAAGAPNMGTPCSAAARMRRGFFGGLVGGLIGTLGVLTGPGGLIITWSLGVGAGAGIGAGGCDDRY